MGAQNVPDVAPISAEPTMGPVQEKETSTSVSAIKNTPNNPPRSARRSLLLTMLLGNVISNAPKNDAAKNMKMPKNSRLGNQWVAIQLKISAVTVSPPNKRVSKMITAMGNV